MTPAYYYDPKTNTLHGPLDRMPPVWDYGFPPDGPSDSQLASAEADFDDAWKSFNTYLQTLPSHPHTFTGQSRVVPEGEIEWRYEVMAAKGRKIAKEWVPCKKEIYELANENNRRRVAAPKTPSIPAHIVDDMKLDSYYDGFKDGSKLTGEPGKERPANKQIRHAATEYIQLPSHRQAIIWDKLGYNGSFSVNTTAQEENKKFIQWLNDNNKVVEFIALFPLSGEPATQASRYTSTSGEEARSDEYPHKTKRISIPEYNASATVAEDCPQEVIDALKEMCRLAYYGTKKTKP